MFIQLHVNKAVHLYVFNIFACHTVALFDTSGAEICDSATPWTGLYMLTSTGKLGYDRPLYDGFLHMTDDMLGLSPMHIKYSSYVYDGFCI